ncbi:MAG: hypothetical protein ACREBF_02720 [Candidatus Micrarchaeales archaeon]
MNLLAKVIVAAIVLVIVLLAVYFGAQKLKLGQQVTQVQAVSLVTNYLQNANPNTVVNVTNVTRSTYPGSWHILTSVAFNSTSPCPSYASYSFDYPQYGFVYRVQNNYTSNCVIYGLEQNKSYILAAAPLAIARSYNLSIPLINTFVSTYGYNNVVVHANFYNSISLKSKTYANIWLVNYSAPTASYSVFTVITQAGGLALTNYTLPK